MRQGDQLFLTHATHMPAIDNREFQIRNFRFKLFHPSLAFHGVRKRVGIFYESELPLLRMTADTRFELHVSIARKIRAFVFGFSYYGVLKIRFVPSRILQMFCISFRTSRAKSRRLKEDQWLRSNMEGGRKL